jgi:hypothetical protein
VKGTQFKVRAVFKIEGVTLAAGEVKAWATCTDGNLALGSETNPVTLQEDSGKWKGDFQISTAPTAVGTLDDFTWTWFVKLKNANAVTPDTSTHTVFVCKEKRAGYKPFDWVAWWSCEWSASQTQPSDIINKIYDKLDETGSTGPSVDLDYEFPQLHGSSVLTLLQDKEGGCGDWQYFFEALGNVHDIEITIHDVQLKPSDGTFYKDFRTYDTERDVDGDAGDSNGKFAFSDHSFCAYGNTIYDPSLYNKKTGTWEDYFKDLFEEYSKDGTNWVLKANCDNQKVRIRHVVDDTTEEYKLYPPW